MGLYKISAAGGTPTQVTVPDKSLSEDSHRWPIFLPDGAHYLYSAINLSGRTNLYSIYVGLLNSNEKKLVVKAKGNAAYVAPGYLIFYRDQTLFAQHFDNNKLALTERPSRSLPTFNFSREFRRRYSPRPPPGCWWPNAMRIPVPLKCCSLIGKANRLALR